MEYFRFGGNSGNSEKSNKSIEICGKPFKYAYVFVQPMSKHETLNKYKVSLSFTIICSMYFINYIDVDLEIVAAYIKNCY